MNNTYTLWSLPGHSFDIKYTRHCNHTGKWMFICTTLWFPISHVWYKGVMWPNMSESGPVQTEDHVQALFSKQSCDCYKGSAVISASCSTSLDAALFWRRALWTRAVCSTLPGHSEENTISYIFRCQLCCTFRSLGRKKDYYVLRLMTFFAHTWT